MKLYNLSGSALRIPKRYPFWEIVLDALAGFLVFAAITSVASTPSAATAQADYRAVSILLLLASILGVFRYLQRESSIWRFPEITYRALVAKTIANHGTVLILFGEGTTALVADQILEALKGMGIIGEYSRRGRETFSEGELRELCAKYVLNVWRTDDKLDGYLETLTGDVLACCKKAISPCELVQRLLSGVKLDVKVSN